MDMIAMLNGLGDFNLTAARETIARMNQSGGKAEISRRRNPQNTGGSATAPLTDAEYMAATALLATMSEADLRAAYATAVLMQKDLSPFLGNAMDRGITLDTPDTILAHAAAGGPGGGMIGQDNPLTVGSGSGSGITIPGLGKVALPVLGLVAAALGLGVYYMYSRGMLDGLLGTGARPAGVNGLGGHRRGHRRFEKRKSRHGRGLGNSGYNPTEDAMLDMMGANREEKHFGLEGLPEKPSAGDEVRITVKKVDGNWNAVYYHNGKRDEGKSADYGSRPDDKEDAIALGRENAKWAREHGASVRLILPK